MTAVATRTFYPASGPAPVTDAALAAYGFHSTTVDPATCHDSSTMQEAWWCDVWVAPGRAITKIGSVVRTAGVLGAGGFNGFALYDAAGNPLWSSVNDDALWTVAGLASKSLGGSAIPPATALTRYRCALASRGYTTPPVMHYTVTSASLVDSARQAFYNGAISAWPGAINPATYGLSTGGYKPLIMLG
jgi:hypothetical protein